MQIFLSAGLCCCILMLAPSASPLPATPQTKRPAPTVKSPSTSKPLAVAMNKVRTSKASETASKGGRRSGADKAVNVKATVKKSTPVKKPSKDSTKKGPFNSVVKKPTTTRSADLSSKKSKAGVTDKKAASKLSLSDDRLGVDTSQITWGEAEQKRLGTIAALRANLGATSRDMDGFAQLLNYGREKTRTMTGADLDVIKSTLAMEQNDITSGKKTADAYSGDGAAGTWLKGAIGAEQNAITAAGQLSPGISYRSSPMADIIGDVKVAASDTAQAAESAD